jgi:2,4-dienoyl-CoA reductase-like NADH-dependent reductase (Old Yellow Enzyme family)
MPGIFDPLAIRGVTLRNRVVVSPMCQYSSEDGFANDWHLVHLGSRAVGGAAVVFAEASAVTPEGRISPWDLGIWKDEHIAPLARIADFVRRQGALPGIQIAHAGRKASTIEPWNGAKPLPEDQGGWRPVGPSPVAFSPNHQIPHELATGEISEITRAFAAAARRAREAGFQVLEIHAAHGYLIHEFLSPLSNFRRDSYGGSLENRMRFAAEVARAARAEWPADLPLFVRISATDWAPNGWDLNQSVELARALQDCGVDLIDCSSGGTVHNAQVPAEPNYQVDFSWRIREELGILTGAVGLITQHQQADEIVSLGRADVVSMAREHLRDPYWSLQAAAEFGFDVEWPAQYLRAAPGGTPARKEVYRGDASGSTERRKGTTESSTQSQSAMK